MIHHLNGKFHAFFIRTDGSIAGIFKSKKGKMPRHYPIACPMGCSHCYRWPTKAEGFFSFSVRLPR